jgi:hypothetical protein
MSQVLIQQYLNQLQDLRKVSDQRIAWSVPKQGEPPSLVMGRRVPQAVTGPRFRPFFRLSARYL